MRRNIPMLKDVDPDAHARIQKIRQGFCPTCSEALIKDLIETRCHKGHGTIYCPTCKEVHVRI